MYGKSEGLHPPSGDERHDRTKRAGGRLFTRGVSSRQVWITGGALLLVALLVLMERSLHKPQVPATGSPVPSARTVPQDRSVGIGNAGTEAAAKPAVSVDMRPRTDLVRVEGLVRAGAIGVPAVFVTGRTSAGEMGTLTREDGTFTLYLPPTGGLDFEVKGLSVVSVSPSTLDRARDDVLVNVAGACSIHGTVTLDGKAIPGSEVEIDPGVKTTSDVHGKYSFAALPAGIAQIHAQNDALDAESRVLSVPLVAGESRDDFDIELDRGASIRGVVVDEKGAPVAQVGVAWACATCPAYQQALTSVDGSFRVRRLPRGRYATTVSSHGFEYQPGTGATFPLVSLQGSRDEADVRLVVTAATGNISGRVVDPRGNPLAGQTVLIPIPHRPAFIRDNQMMALAKAVTEADGSFLFSDLPKGPYDILLGERGDEASLEAVETGRSDVVLTLPDTGTVRGTLQGFPPGSVSVRLTANPTSTFGYRRDLPVSGSEFEIRDVPSGSVWLLAVAGPYLAAERVEVPLRDNRAVVLLARAVTTVRGRVVGQKLPDPPRCVGKVDITGFGVVEIAALPLGQFSLFAPESDGSFQANVPVGLPLTLVCFDGYRTATTRLPALEANGASGASIQFDTTLK